MSSMLQGILLGAILAIAVGSLAYFFKAKHQTYQYRISQYFLWLGFLCLALIGVDIILFYHSAFVLGLCIAMLCGCLATYCFAEYFFTRLRVNEQGIALQSIWSGRDEIAWDDMTILHDKGLLRQFIIQTSKGRHVSISRFFVGGDQSLLDVFKERDIPIIDDLD